MPTAFHDRLERKAIELSFRAGRDYLRGTLRTLKDNRDEAFDYLRLALTEPRFDAAAVERMRAQIMSRLRRESTSPNDMASRSWWATAFPDHPYGRPVNGTLESLPRITVDDLKSYTRRVLARDNLKIAVVGDIDAETTGALLDRTFGALPAKAELTPVAAVVPQGLGRRIVIDLDVPQAVVNFGGPGIAPQRSRLHGGLYRQSHPRRRLVLLAALSRGAREARPRLWRLRQPGLAQSHRAAARAAPRRAPTPPGRPSRSSSARSAASPRRDRPRRNSPRPRPISRAPIALGLDTSNRIASQLVQMQLDNLGIDYIERRAGLIDAVTLADAKRVAKRLLDGGLLVTVVGRPEGVTSTESAAGGSPGQLAKPRETPAVPGTLRGVSGSLPVTMSACVCDARSAARHARAMRVAGQR